MKKLMLMVAIMMMSVAASAQDGKMAAGVNVNYGTSDGYSPLGFGAKFQYEFVDKIRGELSANYFLPKHDAYIWDANLNFHYLVPLGDKANFYPLVGLTYMTSAVTGDAKKYYESHNVDTSDSKLGFNLGIGAEYFLTPNIKANVEAKYQYIKDGDWVVFGVGLAYVF